MNDEDILEQALGALRNESERIEVPSGLSDAVFARLDEPSSSTDPAAFRLDAPMTAEEVLAGEHDAAVASVDFGEFAAGVFARIDAAPAAISAEEAMALAPDVDPELLGASVGSWLRSEHAALVGDPALPWASFQAAVFERIDRPATPDSFDVLAPESSEGFALGELLRAEREAELARVDDRWAAFAAQIDARLAAGAAPGGALDEQALAVLRADVDEELDALASDFAERFRDEVDRRIFDAASPPPSVWERAKAWWDNLGSPAGLGWAAGLAGAAAAIALAVNLTSTVPSDPPAATARAELRGEVTVDALSFEGDVMMIPDEGMTVVVLSDV